MQYGSGNHVYERREPWPDLPAGETFLDVGRICVDETDDVYALNRSEHPVTVFDSSGNRLDAWGNGYFSERPHGMALGPEGNVYCTDDGNHTVRKFTPKGEHLLTLGTENEPSETGHRLSWDISERIASITQSAGPFNGPTGVTVPNSGEIYVADGYGNARVHVFDSEGDLVRWWGDPGAGPGEFRLPHSIHHDEEGRIWVTDRENSRIQIFDADGEFVDEWIDLIRPTDVAFDGEVVYVAELCKRISVFTIEGELLTRWGNEAHPEDDPLFVAPHAIEVDSNGDLYVGETSYSYADIDHGDRTLQKFERI